MILLVLLINLLDNITLITHLTLGNYFNQPLEIPSNIKILTLDCNNINLIENLHSQIFLKKFLRAASLAK